MKRFIALQKIVKLGSFSKAAESLGYTIHDDYTIMTMVEAGLGVSILAELILHRTNYHILLHKTDPRFTGRLPSDTRTKKVCLLQAENLSNICKSIWQNCHDLLPCRSEVHPTPMPLLRSGTNPDDKCRFSSIFRREGKFLTKHPLVQASERSFPLPSILQRSIAPH